MNLLLKKRKNVFQLLTLALFCTFLISPVIASAYSLETGVSRFPSQYDIRIKYVAVLSTPNLLSNVQAATSAWNSSAAQVLFTLNSTSPNIDLTSGAYGSTGWDGLCYYPTILNGNHASIKINNYYASILGNQSECIAHELGHAIGLAHVSATTSLMRATGYKGSATPSLDDTNGVNSFY